MDDLIAVCTSPTFDEGQYRTIARLAQGVVDWPALAVRAEAHGMAPLLAYHVANSGFAIAGPASLQLKLSTLRHRFANRVRMAVLVDILDLLADAGIGVIVLKGGALANLLYAEPGLRPMQDLDLLVAPGDAARAHALLAELGFRVPALDRYKRALSHELPGATLIREGVQVSVEIHYDIFTWSHPLSMTWEDIRRPIQTFEVNGREAFALGHEDMLLHLGHHLVTLGQPMRLIGVADILGYARRFADDIDWELVARDYPFILNTLALLELLAPLAGGFLRARGIAVSRVPEDIGMDYRGWPHTPFRAARVRKHGMRRLLFDSLSAPAWWLRLHYGLEDGDSVILCRYLRHPARLAKLLFQWGLRRL